MRHITAAMAQAGETVHVIAHRWDGAPLAQESLVDGRLIVHRVALDDQVPDRWAVPGRSFRAQVPSALLASTYPSQAFSWQAALLAEQLIERHGIDVIEAQEWEAPLYYLQLRRSLNLGPASRPPCVVHLHSPSERIFAANAWDTTVVDYPAAAALEAYSITEADAILSPSRFVADEAIARYAIPPEKVSVIPYPRGEAAPQERADATWAAGGIVYVGRLEPRKGVREWAEAIALVAADHPGVRFDFVGGDTPLAVTGGRTVGQGMLARLPRSVRRQVRFHGTRDRAGMAEVLSAACASVVPSRWENFPYSCIEAMSSGLPVIVSPTGGMRELVVDDESGWIAADGTPAGLATALRRALAASGPERRRMGRAAAETVSRVCNTTAVIGRHLDLKARLAREALAAATVPVEGAASAGVGGRAESAGGVAVVVICAAGSPDIEPCLTSLRAQSESPVQVCLVCEEPPRVAATAAAHGCRVVARGRRSLEVAAVDIARELAAGDRSIEAVAFVEARVQLEPEFVAVARARFADSARLVVLAPWTCETGAVNRIHVPPAPDAPHVWRADEIAPCLVVRAAALETWLAPSRRELCEAVRRDGATVVTYPVVLATFAPGAQGAATRVAPSRYSSMAQAVQRLHTPLLPWLRSCSPEARRTFVVDGLRHPGRSAQLLASRALRAVRARAVPPARSDQALHLDEVDPHG